MTIPSDRLKAFEHRMGTAAQQVKEEDQKTKKGVKVTETPTKMFVDLTSEPLKPQARPDEEQALLRAMGVSNMADEFFSSTTIFINVRTKKQESDKQILFRQEIWSWMETSLSRGTYKWIPKSIDQFSIFMLYTTKCWS